MRHRRAIAALAISVAAVFALAACGDDAADGAAAERTIEVDMVDNAFHPSNVEVNVGETVRFVFHNRGNLTHEAVIGDETYQMEHARDMRADGGHGMSHGGTGAGDTGAVKPGKRAELTHRFDEPGVLFMGCHEPGHYQAGMQATITVS